MLCYSNVRVCIKSSEDENDVVPDQGIVLIEDQRGLNDVLPRKVDLKVYFSWYLVHPPGLDSGSGRISKTCIMWLVLKSAVSGQHFQRHRT